MYASTSFTSQLVHDYELLVESNTRRLLFQDPVDHRSLTNSPVLTNNHNSTDSYFGIRKFDANVVMILGVLLCALICSLALNSIIRCVLRFLNVAINNDSSLSSSSNSSPQLANKGIKKKALKTFPTVSYSTELKLPSLDAECVICLSEFTKGEKCRQCLLETCRKIVGSEAPSMLPVPETIIRIQPLDHEVFERDYREESR
ncbi:RING-type E3 ubiquitin transferase [Trifolium repens]|nr:RING-type E3 ubiquitin transferase [Trifolium repens]